MPLEQAVLDWQVVGHATGENGERQVDVVAVAARRDMLGGLMQALSRAGLRPVGVDLSAFGMIRALARESYSPVEPGDYVDAPGYPRRLRRGRMAGQVQRRGVGSRAAPEAVPAKLYCNLGDVTNLAVARGSTCLFTRVSPFGVEGIAQKLAERRQLTLEHARQWLVHVGIEQPLEGVEGDARDDSPRARRARRGGRAARRRASPVARVLRGAGGRGADRGRRRLRPGNHHPGTHRAPPARPRPAIRDRHAASPCSPRRRHGGPADPFLRPRPGGVARASRQPDPPRGAPWREGADAHRRPLLRDRRGAGRRPARGHRRRAHEQPDLRPQGREVRASRASSRRQRPRQSASAPLPTSPLSSRPGSRRSRAWPRAASTGSASFASWRS